MSEKEQSTSYHYFPSGSTERMGPFSASQLRQLAKGGLLKPTDLIWPEGASHPTAAAKVKGLFPAPAAAAAAPVGPGPAGREPDLRAESEPLRAPPRSPIASTNGAVPEETAADEPSAPSRTEKRSAEEPQRPRAAPASSGRPPGPTPSGPIGTRRIFLSCVTHEFRAYRDVLASSLAQPGVELRRQEDFVNTGRTTLEKLSDYIRTCDAVIHLVGHGTGSYPSATEVSGLLTALPDFVSKLQLTGLLNDPGLSYTQWEAWLALYYDKPLALYRAADVAQREAGFLRDDRQRDRQQLHWKHLEARGRDRKEFVSPHDLSIEVLRALPMLVPGFRDNVRRGQARDRNLLFAVLALQDEILSREAFVRVCRLWADDSSQEIADLMEQERLLTAEDRAMVEARVERKLKARGGDARQSLAESLGVDVRNSLGDALDAESFASLPDRLAGLSGLAGSNGQWRYRLTRTHGIGGLGVVSVASDSALERSVAVKQLKADRVLDAMAVERFVREARITGGLQHPNIVPVYELGLSPDDQLPFYAMRFVGHRTLHDVIVQHYTDKEASYTERNIRFRGLIQSFLAVCNAVAFAHQQKVIHRDIKPANIMIGDFGEVILLDWGLAKYTDEPEPAPLPEKEETASAAGHPRQTRDGSKIGSPAYMAPEQASGRIQDHTPLTDVYGLGATLYELLTGDVPFSGSTTEELMAEIQTRELPSPRERNASVSPALAAICLKAMAKAPSDRYTSATRLADDIQHWLADEPVEAYAEPIIARLQRVARKRPGVTSAIVATILVGVVGLSAGLYFVNAEKIQTQNALSQVSEERTKAVKARDEAEENFTLARKTLDEFVTEISRNELSAFPGVQDLRKQLALRAVQQYEQFSTTRADDLSVKSGLADARLNYGQVLVSIGPVESAIQVADLAVKDLEEIAEKDPSYENRYRLAKGLSDLGDIYWDISQLQDCEPLMNRAIGILETLQSENPGDTYGAFELARCLNRRGNCRLEPTQRKADYERSRSIVRGILTRHPREADSYQLLAAATFNLAMRYYKTGEAPRKMELLLEAAEADKRVLALTPNAPRAVSNSSLGLEEVGALQAFMGKKDEAARTFEQAEASSRRAVAENPKVTRYQWLLASTLKRKAEFHTGKGEFEIARQYYADAIATLESIVERVDDRPQYAETLIEVRAAVASFSSGIPSVGGKRDEVAYAEALDKAVETAERCVNRFPKAPNVQYQLAKVLYDRSTLHQEQKKWSEVRDGATRACSIFETHVLSHVAARDDYRVSAYIGWLLRVQEAAKEAKDHDLIGEVARKALAIADRVTTSDGVESLGGVFGSWGEACQKDGKIDLAIEAYENQLRVCRGTLEATPWHWYIRSKVAGAHFNLGKLYQQTGNFEKEVRHRQAWLRVFGAYFQGMKTETFLDPDPDPTPEEAVRLRKHMEKEVGMKRFTVPCDFNGLKYPFHIYISDTPWPMDPLEDQARWLEEERGGKIPEEVRESFRKLRKIAHENNVSFQDLCVYALGTAAAGEAATPEKKLEAASEKVTEREKKHSEEKSPATARALIESYAEKSEALIESKRYRDAMAEFRKGIALCEELVERKEDEEWAKAESERLSGRVSYAKVYYIATGDMTTLLGNDADVIPMLLQIRATELAKESKADEVRDVADRLRRISQRTKETMYNAARAYSLALSLVAQNKEAAAWEKEDLQLLAVRCLKDAIALGYNDFEQIGKETDFNAIRELAEFKALLPK